MPSVSGSVPRRRAFLQQTIFFQIDRLARPSLTPHHLRALFATQLWRAGASLPVVQQLLGHESLETTRVYLGVSSDDLHAAMPLLGLEVLAA